MIGTIAATRPPDPAADQRVVVASAELPTGWVLRSGDLRVAGWPDDAVPAGVSEDPRDLVGLVLSSPVAKGEAITPARVSGSGLLTGQPAGTAAAYLPLQSAGVAAMLRPGDRVDVVGVNGDRLGVGLTVLAVQGAVGGGRPAADSLVTDDLDPGVILAVSERQVAAVAQAVDPQTGLVPAVVLSRPE